VSDLPTVVVRKAHKPKAEVLMTCDIYVRIECAYSRYQLELLMEDMTWL
jgi:hypothetical protein